MAIPVVVRDKKGALIGNLGKDDFALTVDRQAKAIRYFDRDDHLPLTLGLLVDTSMSQRAVLDEETDGEHDISGADAGAAGWASYHGCCG